MSGSVHFRRTPRGAITVSPRQREAVALYHAGKTAADVAALYGVSVVTVRQWVKRCADAEEDERNMEAIR